MEFGAKQAIVTCLKVKEGECVVIVTDRETQTIAAVLAEQARLVGAQPITFVMENFGPRPSDGSSPLEFPEEIAKTMIGAQVSIYVAQCLPGELGSFRQKMYRHAMKHNLRHGHMPRMNRIMMETGMAADYSKIQSISKKVFDLVTGAKKITATAPAGTNIAVDLALERKWIIDDGDIRQGFWGNLPAGEVFTAPINGNGLVVIDGAHSMFTPAENKALSKSPLAFALKDGWCVRESVSCAIADLKEKFIKTTFETDKFSSRLGEFGVGTNIGLELLVGNFLQDEKFPGIHIALGDPYPDETGADWTSISHHDGIIKNPTVTLDGSRVIMKDGMFTI